jgi:methylated-DNA-[protein]-cysteine S-methyltransferase
LSGVRFRVLSSPLGELILSGNDLLSGVVFADSDKAVDPNWKREDRAFTQAAEQLRAYFAGELRHFDLPLDVQGTPFQQRVWHVLQTIPFGKTTTYGRLAEELGEPRAVRAVGSANGRNPISIIIPCHRVIGADGSLTGYGGGLPRKQWLLGHERGDIALKW